MPTPITFVSLQELGYPRPSISDAIKIRERVNKRAGLLTLAKMNIDVCLADIPRNLNTRREIQEKIIRNIISERLRRELADKLKTARVDERPLVHRAQLLIAMKLVAGFGRDNGGNELKSRDDFDALGDLAMIINSLFDFENLAGLSRYELARTLAAEMAPPFELMNPEPVGNGMVRIREMLERILPRRAWLKQLNGPNIASQLERIFVFITGLDFRSFRDMTFAMYGFYWGRKDEILKKDESVVLDMSDPSSVVGLGSVGGFLRQNSFTLERLSDLLDAPDSGKSFLLDFTVWRMNPIWQIDADRYACIDPAFLLEKLTAGFFWSVMNALGAGGEDEDKERTLAFSRLWGSLFEEYVIKTLVEIFSDGPFASLLPRPPYENGDEAFDAVIDYGKSAIVVQIKGLFVPSAAKSSGEAGPFFTGIHGKFGLEPKAALEQHLRNIQMTFNENKGERRRVPGFDTASKRTVFPVVVVQDSLLRFGLLCEVLAQDFMKALDAVALMPGLVVRKPVFLAIHELETIVPYVSAGDLTLLDAVETKLREDPEGLLSPLEVFNEYYLKGDRLKRRENSSLEARFAELSQESLARFEAGYYLDQ